MTATIDQAAPAGSPEQIDDLHLLMAVAVLTGQRGVDAPVVPVFEAWSLHYPDDALGRLGIGLFMVGNGNAEGGISMIADAARTARTRADQARDVLDSLVSDFPELAR